MNMNLWLGNGRLIEQNNSETDKKKYVWKYMWLFKINTCRNIWLLLLEE